MLYQNYHRHSSFSNIITPDSVVSNEDYAKRAVELGHSLLSGVEHSWCGKYIEGYELADKYNLKFLFGLESYLVKNRLEKDKTNAHIILLAKNENGRLAINDIISEANLTGYYYRARIDLPLLFSLPRNDVWCTTACVAGIWKYEDAGDIALQIADHFGKNFFLEVQNHNTPSQIALNSRIINIANQNNLNIIFGCDSHMIKLEQAKDREDFLLSKKIIYEDEQGWNLDYPSDEEAYQRFVDQNVLSKSQIKEAMDNTNIFLDVEKYDGNIFNKEIKMPTLYPDKTQEEKDKIFVDEIWCEWDKEKINIPQEKWEHYEEEINKEIDIVVATKHSDYFLLNQRIISHGKELGGVITLTGRGSGVSFYINKLLGFTEVDRISASIKMYPERFMSKTRILETKSLADFDMNLANPKIFAKSQKDILGEECSYPMIAFGTMKPKAAFKMYARAKNIDFETANAISDQIGKYEEDLKHADEEEKEFINVLDYIDKPYHELFLGSKKYLGIVSDVKIAPCGYIVYSGNIRKEIGLIRLNSANGTQHICAIMDGLWAENYKFLKNDLLKVSVVELIDNIYKRINVKPHTVNELIKICEGNKKVWEVYKNGWTMGINQVEQHGTRSRATKYAPTNISELSAFVASVRPGFSSMYKIFENREPFSYGIESFDKLIQTPEMPMSFVLYQEQSMATLNYAGIPMTECYEIIKNIAKKRVEKVLKYKETFIKGFTKKIVEDEGKTSQEAKELSAKTWQILEDSSNYSFNSSHSYCVALDSLYGAYLKSHYPLEFYEVFMKILEDGGDKDRLATTKEEAERAYHIIFPKFSFGQDNRNIVGNSTTNEITSSLKSIKGFGGEIGENMFALANNFQGKDFIDLMIFAEESKIFSSKFESLIKIDYFNQFGNNKKLLSAYEEFKSGKSRYGKNLKDTTKEKRIMELKEIFNNLSNDRLPFMEQIVAEEEILGYIQLTFQKINKRFVYIVSLDLTFAPRVQSYCLSNGKQASLKVYRKTYENNPFGGGEILYCKSFKEKPSSKFVDGKYVDDPNETTWWIEDYTVVTPEQFNAILEKNG
jgi:DNA polymerase III alpha subunit